MINQSMWICRISSYVMIRCIISIRIPQNRHSHNPSIKRNNKTLISTNATAITMQQRFLETSGLMQIFRTGSFALDTVEWML